MTIDVDILNFSDDSLPAVPSVTRGLADLLRVGDVEVEQVIQTVSQGSDLAEGTLHLINSPVFHPKRPISDFRRAAVLLGPRNVLGVAIAVSLIDTYRQHSFNSLDRDQLVLRALISASAARLLSEKERGLPVDECVITALLQDLGMVVIDAMVPDYYANIATSCHSHADYFAHETDDFGLDHAAVTRALLKHWGVSDHIADACGLSHYSDILSSKNRADRLGCIAGISSLCGDLLFAAEPKRIAQELRLRCERDLGWEASQLPILVNLLRTMCDEIEPMVKELQVAEERYKQFCRRAREVLQSRLFDKASSAPAVDPSPDPDNVADALDAATGMYNRLSFPQVLQAAMDKCAYDDEPLSLVLLSIINFPRLKQAHGSDYADKLLREISDVIEEWVRRDDIPGRIADSIFVVALPRAPEKSCLAIAQRLKEQCERTMPVGDHQPHPRFATAHVTQAEGSGNGHASALLSAGTDALLKELRAIAKTVSTSQHST